MLTCDDLPDPGLSHSKILIQIVSNMVKELTLKELRKYKQKFFCVRHYNRRKYNQNFNLLLFTINLHFVTLNQMPTYRKLNLPLTSSIYLVVLSPKWKEDSNRLKYTTYCFTLSNEKRPQTFKSRSWKNSFL